MYFLKNSGADCVCSCVDGPQRGDPRPAGFAPERLVVEKQRAIPEARLPSLADVGNAVVPYVPYDSIPSRDAYENAVRAFFDALRQQRPPPPPPPPQEQPYAIPLSENEYFALPDTMRDSFRPKTSASYGNIVRY